MAKKKKDEEKKPSVHKELDGLKLEINSLGEVTSNFEIDKINEFLNDNVEDKKLLDREDYKEEEPKGDEEE